MDSAVSADTADLRLAFERVPLFASLAKDVRIRLLAGARIRHGRPNDLIVSQGAPTDMLHVLLVGQATSKSVTASGRAVVIARWLAPMVVDKVAMFAETKHPASVVADTTATWCTLQFSEVQAGIRANQLAQEHVMTKLAVAAGAARDSFVDVAVRSSGARLARWLLITSDLGVSIDLPHPQERLAMQLGMTRVTLNRLIHRLAADRLIEFDGSSVVVVDRVRLRQLAEL